MNHLTKKIKIVASAALLTLCASSLSAYAEYPERPIGVMVAYGPGGATDFQARIATLAPAVLIVGKDSKFNSVKDLLDFAKENPGKVTISGAGKFVGHHIAHLQFAKFLKARHKRLSIIWQALFLLCLMMEER